MTGKHPSASSKTASIPVYAPYPFLKPTSSADTAISGRKRVFIVPRWIEGAAMTTSELAEKGPALLRTFTIDLMDSTVPLHFQFPPMRAFFFLMRLNIR
jgi:hypothetical protein